jgi:acetylornithine deacetylase ArgE
VVCGPGDIAQAHSANEWIELEQLRECERFFEAILRWASQ